MDWLSLLGRPRILVYNAALTKTSRAGPSVLYDGKMRNRHNSTLKQHCVEKFLIRIVAFSIHFFPSLKRKELPPHPQVL